MWRMIDERKFLGTGWQFPIRINPQGGLAYISGEEAIRESIWIILATAAGERQMRPTFGCGIHDYVFAPVNTTTRGSIAHQVRQALVNWEPRIDVVDVRVESGGEGNMLLVRVDYRIRGNNAFFNMVYPFYIREGQGA
jgi:phage baseplate assembly protein W